MGARIFDIGDIVMLKSGGREMTVKNYTPILTISGGDDRSDTKVICVWDEDGSVSQKTYHQDMLKLVR